MEAVAERSHEIIEMNETGDTKIIWNPDNEFETQQAKETFERFKKKGYLIYRTNKDGEKREVMHKFDPSAERMIMSPAVVGG